MTPFAAESRELKRASDSPTNKPWALHIWYRAEDMHRQAEGNEAGLDISDDVITSSTTFAGLTWGIWT